MNSEYLQHNPKGENEVLCKVNCEVLYNTKLLTLPLSVTTLASLKTKISSVWLQDMITQNLLSGHLEPKFC